MQQNLKYNNNSFIEIGKKVLYVADLLQTDFTHEIIDKRSINQWLWLCKQDVVVHYFN